jgi:opacity protein-like surface antigen
MKTILTVLLIASSQAMAYDYQPVNPYNTDTYRQPIYTPEPLNQTRQTRMYKRNDGGYSGYDTQGNTFSITPLQDGGYTVIERNNR